MLRVLVSLRFYDGSTRREASRWIFLHYSPTLRWIIVLAYTFLLFLGTAASFNQKVFRLQLSNQSATPFCFCPEVNSAMLFRDRQPIKLQKKHYSDLEYMLKCITSLSCYKVQFLAGFRAQVSSNNLENLRRTWRGPACPPPLSSKADPMPPMGLIRPW